MEVMSTLHKRCSLVLFLAVVCLAQETKEDPFLGTWALNLAKSKFDTGAKPKKLICRWEKAEGGVKVTTEGVDAQGKSFASNYTAIYDGKEYPPSGPWNWDTVANRQIDSRNREDTFRKGGKVIGVIKRMVSADGKVMTETHSFDDSHVVMVFDRQ